MVRIVQLRDTCWDQRHGKYRLNEHTFAFTCVFVLVRDSGQPIVRRDGDLSDLVWLQSLLELMDLGGAEDVVEEHLGEDVECGKLGGALVAVEGGEDARAIGPSGGEDGAGDCGGSVRV